MSYPRITRFVKYFNIILTSRALNRIEIIAVIIRDVNDTLIESGSTKQHPAELKRVVYESHRC